MTRRWFWSGEFTFRHGCCWSHEMINFREVERAAQPFSSHRQCARKGLWMHFYQKGAVYYSAMAVWQISTLIYYVLVSYCCVTNYHTHLLSHRYQAQCDWVPCSGSHTDEIKVLARASPSSMALDVLPNPLIASMTQFCVIVGLTSSAPHGHLPFPSTWPSPPRETLLLQGWKKENVSVASNLSDFSHCQPVHPPSKGLPDYVRPTQNNHPCSWTESHLPWNL